MLKYPRIILLFFSLFRVFSFESHSQQTIRVHSLISGKKEVGVHSMAQDREGNMWFGTEAGLVRYNGINYKLFQEKDGLSLNTATAIHCHNDGALWIGHSNGKVTIYRNEKFFPFAEMDPSGNEKISCISSDGKNNIWIGTCGAGAYMYSGKKLMHFDSGSGLGDDYVYCITEAPDGKIWLGTDAGITIFNTEAPGAAEYLTMKNGLPDNIVHEISAEKNGDLWIATRDSGICRYILSEKKLVRVLLSGGMIHGPVNAMLAEGTRIWLGTEKNGLLAYVNDNGKYTRSSRITAPAPGEKISCLFNDSEKSVWIGTPKGVAQVFRGRFDFFTVNEGLPSNEIRAALVDSKNFFWVSTAAGLTRYHYDESGSRQRKDFILSDKEQGMQVVSLFEGKNGMVWAGTYGHGALLINPESGKTISVSDKDGLESNNVMSVCEDSGGNIWLATLGGGIARVSFPEPGYKGKPVIKNFLEEDGAGSIYVYSALCDSRGTLWFGTDGGGLVRYENGIFSSFNSKIGKLKSDVVFAVAEDDNGVIWFTAQDAGVYSFNGRSFANYGTEEGIRDLSPAILFCDKQNNIGVAHSNGIDVISKGKKIRQYNLSEGGFNFIPSQNAVTLAPGGEIWLGTENGMVLFRSSLDSLDYIVPSIRLTELKVALEPRHLGAPARFTHKQNQLSFEFLGLFLRTPEKVRYRYKLEGYDKDWSHPTENRIASFPNLPDGEFTFLVCASNAEGIWSEPASYRFSISPPFWKTWWFYIVCAVSLAVFFYVSMKLRVKALQNQNRILEEKVENRTREVVEQKKIIEEKNQDIMSSIRYAKRIQDALLPAKKYMDEHLRDYFVLFKQKDIVSGDFYWVNHKDGKTFFAAIDCTGHGVPGAFVSLVAHANIQRAVVVFKLRAPSLILDTLNEGVTEVLSRGGESDIKDGMDISLCGIDRKGMTLEFSGANHHMLFVRNGEMKEFRGDKQPIGQFISRKSFTNHSVNTQKGDLVYLYSDGYGDQFGGKEGKKFKRSRFKELILSIHHKPLSEQQQILDDTIEQWRGNHEQVDDILVMGVKI